MFSGAIPLDEVIEFYLDINPWGVQPSTITAYRGRLKYFQEFCTKHDIKYLGDICIDTLDKFQNYLREESSLGATSSIKSCLAAPRKFLQYCERREIFDHGFHKLVILPTLSKHEGQDERWFARENAKEIVDYLEIYRPFTKAHVVWAILSETGIRQYVYGWSRPCAIGEDCPVGKDPDTCEAAQTNNAAYDCPESVSPHPIRRGYITHLHANGVPTEDVISERCDANPDTIE